MRGRPASLESLTQSKIDGAKRMCSDVYDWLTAPDRRAYRIEDLTDELAAQLEAGLEQLRHGVTDDSDTVVG